MRKEICHKQGNDLLLDGKAFRATGAVIGFQNLEHGQGTLVRLLIAAGTLQLTENPVAWILPDIVVVHRHLQNLAQDIVDSILS